MQFESDSLTPLKSLQPSRTIHVEREKIIEKVISVQNLCRCSSIVNF